MSSLMSTILIIGGTSGLGEGFARRFHAQGCKVIITGRRLDRLTTLSSQLPGLETYQWDISDIPSLTTHATTLTQKYPSIDTIILNAGIQSSFTYLSPSESTDVSIRTEVDTNLTAPLVLCRTFVPFLAEKARRGEKVRLVLVGSGLGFVPFGFYPVYCPTKAGMHSFAVALRQQLNFAGEQVRENWSVCEVSPPYVDTGLDVGHRDKVNALLGDHAPPPMPLEEYLDLTMERLAVREGGKMLKEITAPGFSEVTARMWREGFGKMLEGMGIEC